MYSFTQIDNKFVIIESKPNKGGKLTILETLNRIDAEMIYKHLKSGGCFNSWTPTFFITSKGHKHD